MFFYDTVIIGSGVSGMTAGIILSKSGRSVLVLEQNKKPGGLMQTFVRKSNLFPTGVHKLGSLGPGEILRHYFKFLGVFDRLRLVPMERSGYEQFVFPESSFTSPGGYTALFKALVRAFPLEEKAISSYLNTMKITVRQFPLYNITKAGSSSTDSAPLMEFSTSIHCLLLGLGCSEKLIKVLTANKLLHGMEPSECPAIIHFLVTDSFLNSSWKVDEAKTPLAVAFTDALTEVGGHLKCSAMVSSIKVDSGKVKGVKLLTGEEIACNEVLFTGHPQALVDLCPEKTFRPAFYNRISRAENTTGIFGFAAKWLDDKCPFALRDVYLYLPSLPDLKNHQECLPSSPLTGIYLSALPRKQRQAFSMTALMAISEKDTRCLMDLKSRDHDQYIKAKDFLAASMIAAISEKFDSVQNKIEIAATYTPLTFNRYTLSPLGTAYGIKKSVKTFWKNQLNPATRVRGLFLAGQSINMSGVLGALISSVQTCIKMEGLESLADTIANFKERDGCNNLNQASHEGNKGRNQ